MKKQNFPGAVCAAVFLAVLLSACGGANSGASSQSPAVPDGSASETPPVSSDTEGVFAPGTWQSDSGQYYFFDEGDATGRTASLEDGTGVGFTYTVNGSEAVFAMGGADVSSSCTVSGEGDQMTLEWADGTVEHLSYVSDKGSDAFRFYSNQELAGLALSFYQNHNDAQESQNLTSAAQTNEDGSVSIQVYENLGGHNSTAAWYTVDRLTAAGTDGSGEEVDLTA